MRKLRHFLRISWADKKLLLEALITLTIAWFMVKVLPRSWSTAIFGEIQFETPYEFDPGSRRRLLRIARALRLVKRNLPWHSTCLMDATAGKLMLNRRHLPSTIYIGFKRGTERDPNELEGHAWLRSGPQMITGGETHSQFKVLTCYGTRLT